MASVGVFDSGVGGVSVLREVRARLPREHLVYVADSAFVPYGAKPPAVIRERSLAVSEFLIEARQAKAIVVACNTATAHAVDVLRSTFRDVPIVGMEPAIKPAAKATRSGVVGILATEAALDGERVAQLIERNADGIEVLTQACPGLAEQVEAGDLSGPATLDLIRQYTAPMLERGADTIVLGCTHYVFLRDSLQRVVGPSVTLIDTGAAVARQTERVLADRSLLRANGDDLVPGTVRFVTSGDTSAVRLILEKLWGEPVPEVELLAVEPGKPG